MGASLSSLFRSQAAAYCMGTYTSGPISGTCISSAWGATKRVMVTALLLQRCSQSDLFESSLTCCMHTPLAAHIR